MVLSLENSINTGRGIPRVGPGVGPYTLSTRNYSICLYKNILTGKSNHGKYFIIYFNYYYNNFNIIINSAIIIIYLIFY